MSNRQTSDRKNKALQVSSRVSDPLASRTFAAPSSHEEAPRPQVASAGSNPLANISILNPDPTPRIPIQPKLIIGVVGDKYEQEADRVAQQVVQRINAPQSPNKQPIQRQDVAEEEELQMKPLIQCKGDLGGMAASPEVESSIQRLRGQGQPLSDKIREPMEQAFGGVNFRGVTIHTDAQSDQLNQSIQAKAFTTGQDIFFRKGAYEPGSRGGQELIAHELTHVVQQTKQEKKKTKKNGRSILAENSETTVEIARKHQSSVIQRVLNTALPNYTAVINQYPNAAAAAGKCHDAARALRDVAIAQNQPYNYVWAWCEDLGNPVFGGMEDHVALESGHTVYDPTLQQFPGIPAGMWIGTIDQWRTAVRTAYKIKFRNDQANGHFTVSYEMSQSWHGNAWHTPATGASIGTFNSPANQVCTIL